MTDTLDQGLKPHWFQILLALAGEAMHGTAIMEEVLERTDGEMHLWPGTLYGSLRDLAESGLIGETEAPDNAPSEGGKRRFYAITPRGREALAEEAERLAEWAQVARARNRSAGMEPA
jgi:DNA-binding PadR family transcriptional regulator